MATEQDDVSISSRTTPDCVPSKPHCCQVTSVLIPLIPRPMCASDTAPHSAPRVPPELCDHIIDYLRDEPQALSACALACKTFLPRTRYIRFQNVTISATGLRKLKASLDIVDRTPGIASLVQGLTVRRAFARFQEAREPSAGKDGTLATLLRRLPGLRQLMLDSISIDSATAAVFRDTCPRVAKLQLARCQIESVGLLFALCEGLPSLRDLSLRDVHTRRPAVDPQLDSLPTFSLRSLHIESRQSLLNIDVSAHVVAGVVKNKLHTSLHSFHVCDLRTTEELDAVQELLRGAGPSLQHLALSFAGGRDLTEYNRTSSLCLFPGSLRTRSPAHSALCLALSILAPALRCTRGLRTLALSGVNLKHPCHLEVALLAHVDAPTLEHVEFRVLAGGCGDEHLDNVDWDRLARTLAEPRFGALRRVTFDIIHGKFVATAIEHIHSRMAPLERGGRVVTRFRWRPY